MERPETVRQWDGENYIDAEEFEQSLERRSGERFYTLPDGLGGQTVVSAETMQRTVPEAGTAEPEHDTDPWLSCPPGGPLEHLWLLDEGGRAHTLVFPAYDPTLTTRRRYAGYRLPIPTGVDAVRVTGIIRQGLAPDVAVMQTGGAGSIAVVNNYATESIPETLFRHAMVSGTVTLPAGDPETRELVVMEGGWARRTLDVSCRPVPVANSSHAGKVTVEFLTRSRAEP